MFGGFIGDLIGGVTSIFTGGESQEMGEDLYNSAMRGVQRFEGAGRQKENFLEPFTTAAEPAYQALYDLILGGDYSQFQESPGYQFAQDEAQKATERSAAARGGLVSGRTLKELDERSQQVANQQFQNYLGNLGGLFGTSFSAGEAKSNVPFEVAAQTTPLDIYSQQAMGEGNIARVAGLGSGIGQIGSAIGNMFSPMPTGGYSMNGQGSNFTYSPEYRSPFGMMFG